MRYKQERTRDVCHAAKCVAPSTVVVGGVDAERIELCDRHWQERCAESERAALERLDDDLVAADFARARAGGGRG